MHLFLLYPRSFEYNRYHEEGRLKVNLQDHRPITADYGRLSIEEKKILLHLLDNKNITRREAIILLNLGKTKVKELFKALLEKELLERKGQGRSTYYVVSKKEDKG